MSWTLLARYALLIALARLIPIPLVDGWVEMLLRRAMVRQVGAAHGLTLPDDAIATLADEPSAGCWGWLRFIACWPVKKLLKSVLWVWTAKGVIDAFSEQVHRGLMVHAACERGALPGDPARVRAAMERALAKADTRLVERALLGVFRDHADELNRVVWHATRIARAQARGERADAVVASAEGGELAAETEPVSGAMASALRATGVVAEVLHFFEAALAEGPSAPAPDQSEKV